MPYQPSQPVPPSPQVNDLRKAVARWEYEGGAGIHGPHEGYGTRVTIPAAAAVNISSKSWSAQVDCMTLDQLVRLLFAASTIRNDLFGPAHDEQHRESAYRRSSCDVERISRSLIRMIGGLRLHIGELGRS